MEPSVKVAIAAVPALTLMLIALSYWQRIPQPLEAMEARGDLPPTGTTLNRGQAVPQSHKEAQPLMFFAVGDWGAGSEDGTLTAPWSPSRECLFQQRPAPSSPRRRRARAQDMHRAPCHELWPWWPKRTSPNLSCQRATKYIQTAWSVCAST